MIFHVTRIDKPEAVEQRNEVRASHLEWAKGRLDRIKLAANLLEDDHSSSPGSILIIEGTTKEALLKEMNEDPYVLAGIVKSIEINAVRCGIGEWLPDEMKLF